MKIWLKIISAVSAVIFIIGAAWYFSQEQKECCLCSAFRYHAPCLIDLETGKMIELDLYLPHETKVAELSDPQPEMSTFSFVRLEGVTGTKLSDSKTIEIEIPASEKTTNPALCKSCRRQLNGMIVGRYVMADLYNEGEKTLIPIDSGLSMVLRCYEIFAQKDHDGALKVVIQGILE